VKSAHVLGAGRVSIPESGRDALQIITDHPWEVAGERGPETGLYVDPAAPAPVTGDPVTWDGRWVWLAGERWRKMEYEFDPNKALG
jgi:hypothetical protein